MKNLRVRASGVAWVLVLWGAAAGLGGRAEAAVAESRSEGLRDRIARLPAADPGAVRFHIDAATGRVTTLLGRFAPASDAGTPEQSARDFLAREAELFALPESAAELVFERTTEDIGGAVVRFRQERDGLPVFDGGALVGFDNDGQIVLVQNDFQEDLPARATPQIDSKQAMAAAAASLGVDEIPGATARLLFVRGDKDHPGLHLAYEVGAFLREPLGDWHVFVGAADGEVVRTIDQLKRTGPACSACTPGVTPNCGRVFFHHPIDALNNPALTDASNVDAAQIGCLLTNLTSGTNLDGTYVTTAITTPRVPPPYNYLRSVNQPGADEVNAYYHLNRAKEYLNSLGFPAVMNFSIGVNAHEPSLGESAQYVPLTHTLEFGEGGVDDAQDPDILYHEYGHAIQDNQVPGFGTSDQSAAAGEGFGDYWASALTDDLAAATLGTACVGAWNATAFNPYTGVLGTGCVRRVDSAKLYPRDTDFEPHHDGEIWSSALWALRGAVGAPVADALIIKSHTYLVSSARFRQSGDALLTADAALYASAHAAAIHTAMKGRGLPRTGTPASSSGLTQTAAFVCETDHDYAPYAYKECRYTQPGALRLRFHFSAFNTEAGTDWAYLSDANYLEVQALEGQPFGVSGGYSAAVTGDTIVLRFKADASVQGYGFRIDSVEYAPGTSVPSGRVPENQSQGTPLRLAKAGSQVTLTWGASCAAGDNDYEVYEGALGNFTSHAPAVCSTAGAATWTLTPLAGNRYFLVVSRNATREGSYGRRKPVAERPVSASACLTQEIAASCP